MIATAPTPVYTDFQSLTRLKTNAREQSPEALQEVARQFEALFVQMMLKSMRSAGSSFKGYFDSDQSLFYRDMFDQQLALTLAKDGQFGLADMIVRQLDREGIATRPIPALSSAHSLSTLRQVEHSRTPVAAPAHHGGRSIQTPAASAVAPAPEATTSTAPLKPSSPEDFVRRMWTHAQEAARRLRQNPEVLIAQAALETGWGKSMPTFSDGQSSFNLFGIKADRQWQGPRVVNSTLEFVDGLPERRRDGFRAYGSYAESFNDYVDFLYSNPRYVEALRLREDGMAYIRAIHRAGYATDPNYASKIERILNNPALNQALSNLKSVASSPITSQKG